MLVSAIINKNFPILTKEATILEAIEQMSNNKNGFVVFCENNKVIGILTEKDLVTYLLNADNHQKSAYQYAHKDVITFKENRSVEYVLFSLIEFGFRRVVIVDNNDNFVGVTTQEELIHYVDKEVYKIKMKLYHLSNLHTIITLDHNSTIKDAFEIMKKNKIGSVIVTKENVPEGIITERDTVKVIQKNKKIDEKISTIMSKPIIYAKIDETVETVLATMKENHIQRIVVQDRDQYKILSIRDLLNIIKGTYGSLIEKKLEQSKLALNSIQEAIVEVSLFDREYIISWCNKKAFDLFGVKVIDQSILKVLDKDIWDNIIHDTLDTYEQVEYKIKIGDIYFKITCNKENEFEEIKFRIIFVDITQLEHLNQNLQSQVDLKTKQLQEINKELEKKVEKALQEHEQILKKLHQAEKMSSMGEMIGNISHQWRQPLSVISTGATGMILQKKLNDLSDEQLEKTCNIINDNAQYLSNTIDDFKNFIKNERKFIQFNLSQNIETFLNLVSPSFNRHSVELVLNLDHSIDIKGYPNELIQCFINIFNNSKDALKESDVEKKSIFINTYMDEENIVIEFKDNAGGIPENIIDRVFEPYFTTKHQFQGTGLGLSMSYTLITQGMKGSISVQNLNFIYKGNSYKGAQFIIKIPKLEL